MKNLPSWLSAITAISALTTTIVLALRSAASDKRKELLERRAVALSIIPDLELLAMDAQGAREIIVKQVTRANSLSGILSDKGFQEALGDAVLPFPYLLERNVDQLAQLERHSAEACLSVVTVLSRYQRALADRTEALRTQRGSAGSDLIELTFLLESLADRCRDAAKITAHALSIGKPEKRRRALWRRTVGR